MKKLFNIVVVVLIGLTPVYTAEAIPAQVTYPPPVIVQPAPVAQPSAQQKRCSCLCKFAQSDNNPLSIIGDNCDSCGDCYNITIDDTITGSCNTTCNNNGGRSAFGGTCGYPPK